MKIKTTLLAVLALCSAALTSQATLNFDGKDGAEIQFGPGSQFTFAAAKGETYQWEAAGGINGSFTGGPWTYGAITIENTSLGIVQSASVAPKAGSQIIINDGSANLVGNVSWINIATLGTAGSINANASVNITGITYGGSNPTLLALVNSVGTGSAVITFQFNPGKNLSDLSALEVAEGTSFSGSISAVPEPGTILAGALLLLPFGATALRIIRKKRE